MTIGAHIDVRINDANIKHNHIYLAKWLEFFPAESIGGGAYRDASDRKLAVKFVPGSFVETDIDGSHKFLRCRSEVGAFFRLSNAIEDDIVRITRLAATAYVFEVIKK